MKKHKWILFFLLLGFVSCNDDNVIFETSTEGLELKFMPVAGGAMMHYTLPNNRDIFAMNIRYLDAQGNKVLKACGYSGDSLLLDGFTRAQEASASITFVNQNNVESEPLEYKFNTLDSAPWAFFNDIEVYSSWNGFRVIYKSPSVVTGMAHVFYLGTNPVTNQQDTILIKSFPIVRAGDTLNFVVQQERAKNTVVIRTEDFQGYRVRQEIYPDIDAYQTEKWPMTADDFKGPSVENEKAKTGVKYLFDGELKGEERLIASASQNLISQPCTEVYATYLAGPQAYGKPIILDMREQKIPAWIRMYCLYPLRAINATPGFALGEVWLGSYEDKVPCKVVVYGNNESPDPNSGKWEYLGKLHQDSLATGKNKWSNLTSQLEFAPQDVNELAQKDPVYVDVVFPARAQTYRYLKIIVNDTFKGRNPEIDRNKEKYFTLHELEVYVKKN